MYEAAGNQRGSTPPPETDAVMSVLAAIGRVPLVDREAERHLIGQRLGDASQAPGEVIVISGEPGVGKTRLALATADGPARVVVSLRCDEHLRDVPYSPFLDYTGVPEELPSLLALPDSPIDPELTRLDLFEKVHRLLEQHAGGQTCVLLVDQLEWIDAASVELLRHLVRRSQEGGRVVLATLRIGAAPIDSSLGHLLAEWNRARRLLDVPLGPLDEPGADEFVVRLLGEADPGLRAAVTARADGLPFFIEEYVRQLVTEGHANHDDGVWRSDDPTLSGLGRMSSGIAASVMRRLDHVPPNTRRALRAVSVLGTRAPLSLLGALVGCLEEELIEDLEPAIAARIFQLERDEGRAEPSHGSFTHALVRDGLYTSLPREERRALHQRAAEVLALAQTSRSSRLTASADASMIAYHAERAHAWTLAYEASVAAGDAALTVLAGQEDAFAHFDRARGYVRAGHVTIDAGAELALDYRLVSTLKRIGRLDDAADAAREMVVHASGAGQQAAEAWALIQIAGADTFSDRFDDIESDLERGRGIADRLGDAGLLATALATRGVLLSARGMLDEADQHFLEAIPLAERAGDHQTSLQGLTYVGLTASWRGRYREAIERCEEATRLAEAAHDAAAIADARFSLALALGGCGEYEAALAALHQLLDLAERSGEPFYAARVPNTIGWIYRELALVEQALPWDERACAEPDNYGGICHFKARANSLINLGLDYIALERLGAAASALDEADDAVNKSDYLRWRSATRLTLARGELALARGRSERAIQLAADALAQATSTQAVKHAQQAHDLAGRALVTLGQQADAIERLERAVALASEIEYLAGQWRSLVHLAEALARHGRVSQARERRAEAARIIGTIAGNLRDSKLRADFLAAPDIRAVLDPAESAEQGHLTFPLGLSEREVEVLCLVAEGLTNAQIAGRLFISPKTVSSHLVSIFGKLGVTSRAGATRFALEHGLA